MSYADDYEADALAEEALSEGQVQKIVEEVSVDRQKEIRRTALQVVAELDEGLQIIDRCVRAGQFTMARDSVKLCRELVKAQERMVQALLRGQGEW